MIYNGFEYNEHGVCLNPDIPYSFGKWNQYYFEIKVSETSRGWVYGYNWNAFTRGGGGGCFLHVGIAYPTKSKAIVEAAEYIKSRFQGDSKATKAIAELDRIISEESEHRPKIKQMTIFDYL